MRGRRRRHGLGRPRRLRLAVGQPGLRHPRRIPARQFRGQRVCVQHHAGAVHDDPQPGRTAALRGRVGFTFGDNANLLYATGGLAWSRVGNSFSTSNGVNTFTDNGDSDSKGPQYGVGYERKLGANLSIGAEYLVTKLTDDEYRVRAQGPAPATNPFILGNPAGTDFRRGNEDFETSSLRLTLNYRF